MAAAEGLAMLNCKIRNKKRTTEVVESGESDEKRVNELSRTIAPSGT
jgi:hypothetical protein